MNESSEKMHSQRDRVPFDLAGYRQRVQSGPCFVCDLVAGTPGSEHEVVFDDDEHVAFLGRYPTMYGHVLVAPKMHVEHVVRDFEQDAYLRLQAVLHRVALAVEAVVPSERTYLLSLGSQQGNAHVHWHVQPLTPGTPYEQQQFHALMAENGVIPWSGAEAAELGRRLRAELGSGK
ncbi:HIT family protein [Nocardia sp. CA-120079]|uniref:HIT family protein n=1 Tax=Nocardia sp. CA-120079 TaxID=3239974 RepID=UPI003D97B422